MKAIQMAMRSDPVSYVQIRISVWSVRSEVGFGYMKSSISST